jgi:hypothetical protein
MHKKLFDSKYYKMLEKWLQTLASWVQGKAHEFMSVCICDI